MQYHPYTVMQRVDDCSKLILNPLRILVPKTLFQRLSLNSAPVMSRNLLLISSLYFLMNKFTLFHLALALSFNSNRFPSLAGVPFPVLHMNLMLSSHFPLQPFRS